MEPVQLGGGLVYYQPSVLRQKGSGLGAIFGSLMRKLLPFAKNVILPAAKKYVAPHAKEALKNIASDVINSTDTFGHSLKKNTMNALKRSGSDLINQSGTGRRSKRSRTKTFGAIPVPTIIPNHKFSSNRNKKVKRISIF